MNRLLIATLTLIALSLGGAAEAKQKHCPPGLAKKSVPCVPPGQVNKAARYYAPGDWIGDDDYHVIVYPDRYGLPLLPRGQRYVIVDGRIMVVSEENYQILSILRAVQAILD